MRTPSRTDITVAKPAATPNSPIKVCMHVLTRARTDVRVMRAATALREANFEVSVVDVEWKRLLPAQENIYGIWVKHIIHPGWYISTRFKPLFLVKFALLIIVGVIRLIRTPADIYHAHDEDALPATYIAAQLRRKPLIFEAHELPLCETSKRWPRLSVLPAHIFAFIVPRCAGFITSSPHYVPEIQQRYHVPEVTITRNVPPYRPVAKSNRLRQRLGLGPDVRIALYQGGLQPNRTLDKLIRAAPFLEPNIVIVLMGADAGTTKAQLETLIATTGVADRVKFLPPVPYEELLEWTASADIGLLVMSPDYSQHIRLFLPNKLFEYLMAGVPVLSSELDAVTEVIRAYDVGKVIPSVAPENVAAAITAMLNDHVALARMSRNALDAARQELCWENEKWQLIQLYQSILKMRNT